MRAAAGCASFFTRIKKLMTQKLQEYSGQVEMRGWHIDHEEEAHGSDDPTNKISVTTIYERLA